MRYFFDLGQGDEIAIDERGVELAAFAQAQEEAVRSLAEMARDIAMGANDGALLHLSMDVRDESGPVMRISFDVAVDHKH